MTKWLHQRNVLIRDDSGCPIAIEGIVTYITERKQAEEALYKSHANLIALIENTEDYVLLSDRNARPIMWNSAYARVMKKAFGIEMEPGLQPHKLLSDEEIVEWWDNLHRRVLSGEKFRVEYAHEFSENDIRHHEVSYHPIIEDDEVVGFSEFTRDITERKQGEQAARRERDRTQQYLDIAGVIIVALNERGEITLINRRGCEMLGYDEWALLGRNWFDTCLPLQNREDVKSVFEQLMAGGIESVEHYENPVLTSSGEERLVAWHSALLTDESGTIIGTLSSGEDITGRKRAEEERLAHVHFLESMERIDSAIRQAADLEQMMSRVLEVVLEILQCDRVYFLFPCDPDALTWSAPMECARPEYPGAFAMGQDFPMTPELATSFREVLESEGPVVYDPQTGRPVPDSARQFSIQSAINIAIYPRIGKPWLFGVCQCSYARVWAVEEQSLLLEISRRLEDSLSSLLFLRSLQENEERYRALVDASPSSVAILQDERFVFVNPAGARMFGFSSPGEVIGIPALETITPEFRDLFGERVRTLPTEEDKSSAEIEVLRRDGTIILVEATSVPIVLQSESAALLIGQDITERVEAERERERLLAHIREQAQRVQQIIDSVPEGVLLLDADGRVILANPVAETELVVLAGARVGDTLTHLGDHSLAELLTPPPKGLWHEISMDDQVFQVIAWLLEAGPTSGGWVLVIRDVTQQREFDQRIQQHERLAAVGQLAAGIAHDFNNIMATIVLYAQMSARTEGVPDRVRERMGTINQQAKHATELIQQILDFSRRAVLERQPLDLLPLLKEQVRLLERTLPESIEISLTFGADEYIVNADPTRIQAAITNLAVNARNAMPEGGELRIGLERMRIESREKVPLPEMERGEWIRVIVSDTGTGIPSDVLPRIFEPFFTTRAPLGSGLGLAQVHGIVTVHEGHIGVETKLGHGTTFTIYLPVLAERQPELSALLTPGELSALPKGQGEVILVVEDNQTTRAAMVDSLELLNYRTLEASEGQEALGILEEYGDEIALVVSDVVMPKMGGIALLHALREQRLAVPVVLLTGHPLREELDDLRAQGAATLLVDWLPKPPSLEQLAEAASRALTRDIELGGGDV